ncbi:type I DNA topoisomerase [Miniimonas arenae]|uniref:DNA topoisomerase 1 n=1 Tax=Miniimonas arenae TaxID=676201 RepID=A0A5C5BEZ9_9MICO|nr:type I DNA topoisomerase [Miniimonas arenae]TNU76687.1 type I DNA topoisomerase [Miniimonas arenae]
MPTKTPTKLVIVESPTKARTITPFLGAGYEVEASVGHIRDLPQPSELPAEMKKGPYRKFAVDVDNGFDPYYVVDADKRKKVAELKKKLKDADELYLATDEDREGEAIAWHLLEVLQPKVPVKRMVFHEITREAIQRALTATRDLDTRLVDAQETRRILDRLYGYEVSPVLWRKIGPGLSAGRVQSVATRLVVERERERMAFVAASYWDVTGTFTGGGDAAEPGSGTTFTARLSALGGTRVATGRDFDDTGALRTRAGSVVHLDEAATTALVSALDEASFAVVGVDTKPYTRRPAAPFTTSTLQQEASRKLRLNSRATMRTAQGLYENGYITYMRTDSVTLSTEAIAAARRQAADLYGAEFVPEKPRVYANKSKNAQEAHEAIRPAGDHFRTPAQVAGELSGDQFRLYELIWKRTVASQMADARGSTATLRIGAPTTADVASERSGAHPSGTVAEFSASGTVITFRGFLAAYEEGRDAGRYDAEASEARLPDVSEGDAVTKENLEAAGHETSPPPRYTEASLTAALEERGIGRPSTYAATIGVITDRGYVLRRGQALVPSWLAFSVVRLLEDHFGSLVDYDFTAAMESDLDRIASGEQDRVAWLQEFYFGPWTSGSPGLQSLVDDLGEIDARDINSIPVGNGITLRVGRYGPYLEGTGPDGEALRASVPEDVAPDELTPERALELLTTQSDGDRELGTDPATGYQVVARNGRYGPYVTEVIPDDAPAAADEKGAAAGETGTTATGTTGTTAKSTAAKGRKKAPAKVKPRTGSLLKSMSLDTVTLEQALQLMSLPRVVGTDPESGEEITAQNGRYGPYLKKGTDSRSLETEEQIFDVTLEEALAIYAQPKQRRGQRAAASALRELGNDPVSEKPVLVKDGRFGPYVTDGTTNVTIPKAESIESLTPERAYEMLAEKRAKGPAKRPAARGRASTTSRSSTTRSRAAAPKG